MSNRPLAESPTAVATKAPSGTVTFLFSDIEGSTQLLHRLGDQYAQALEEQRAIIRAAFQQFGGCEIDTAGDAFFVAFSRAQDGVAAAIAAQRQLASHPWPEGETLRVRMALHTGEPIATATGYVGMDVHRAARLCSAGHGGQILISNTTRQLVADRLPESVTLRELGNHRLKDLQQPETIYQVVIPSPYWKATTTTFALWPAGWKKPVRRNKLCALLEHFGDFGSCAVT